MGKGGAAKQQVNEYYMSIHSGLCVGPIDAVTGLYVGEKLAWEGEVSDEASIYVNAPSLFGGAKDGGGVGGIMYFLPGGPTQVMPNELAARQGLTTDTSPAYRGVASVYFIGVDSVPSGSIDVSGNTGGDGTTTGGGGNDPIGGDGSGTGGGGADDDGQCVVADAWMPDGKRARDVRPGDRLLVLDYATMNSTRHVAVTNVAIATEPTVRVVMSSGCTLTVSRSTPVTLRDGRMIGVMDALDQWLFVSDTAGTRWEQVAQLIPGSTRDVIRITAGGATFAAGDAPDAFVFTHNVRKI